MLVSVRVPVSMRSIAPAVVSVTYRVLPTTTIASAPASPVIVFRMFPLRLRTTISLSRGLDTNILDVAGSTTIGPKLVSPRSIGPEACADGAGAIAAQATKAARADATPLGLNTLLPAHPWPSTLAPLAPNNRTNPEQVRSEHLF